MKRFFKKVFLNNVQLKIFSFILAYACWSLISQSHTDDVWVDASVCFYESEKIAMINAPEKVKINLSGKRAILQSIDTKEAAVHIDPSKLKQGKNMITLSEHQVTLPEEVKITGWSPTHLEIEVN